MRNQFDYCEGCNFVAQLSFLSTENFCHIQMCVFLGYRVKITERDLSVKAVEFLDGKHLAVVILWESVTHLKSLSN